MIKLHHLSYNPHEVVKSIAEVLQLDYQEISHFEYKISVPNHDGKHGVVSGLSFNDGINLLTFSGKINANWELEFKHDSASLIRFLFCQQGNIFYRTETQEVEYELSKFLSATIIQVHQHQQLLNLPAQEALMLIVVDINKEKFLSYNQTKAIISDQALQEIFENPEGKKNYFHIGYYNLAIAECIHHVIHNSYEGLVRRVFLHSKALELIALKIYQYQEEKRKGEKFMLLEGKDIEMVVQAKKIQASTIKNPPTIRELARRIGTNENKLKQNFKKVYHKTINESLTEERLNYAKLLLAAHELNIKQISLEIGYKNPSHFSKLFKARFGILPKDFLKTIKSEINL